MSVFLSVLAIIGKILLVILAVLLALLLIVLFVPVRFKVDACLDRLDLDSSRQTTGIEQFKNKVHLQAFVHWILYLVRGTFHLNACQKDKWCVKVLFFQIFPKKEKERKVKKANQKNNADRTEVKKEDDAEKLIEQEKAADESATVADEKAPEGSEETENDNPSKQTESSFSVHGFFRFLWKIFGFILGLINKPYAVFQKFLYTISGIRDKISLVRDLLETDTYERGKQVLFKQAKCLLKGLAPKKCRADIAYGAGDPCLTAEILAVYSVFYPIFRGQVRVVPDFDRRFIEGEIHLKGRLTLFRVVWSLAVVYFNKDLRKILKRLKYIKDLK